MNSVEMVVNTVIERFNTNPTDMSSTTAVNVVAPGYLLDEDTAIRALLDVRMALGPPL